MDDSELEARLRAGLHRRFDAEDASPALHRRVSQSLRSEPAPAASVLTRIQPFLLAAAAVVVMVAAAVVIGPRLGRDGVAAPSATPVASPAGSPSPAATASASAAPESVAPSPSAASVPSVSTTPWTALTLRPITGGPTSVMTLTAWSGGYLAIGDPSGTEPATGWLSTDGITWTPLPYGSLPAAVSVVAVSFGKGLYVLAEDSGGVVHEVTSADGALWAQPFLSDLAVSPDSVASGPAGLVATTARQGDGLRFKPTGVASVAAWEHTSLPNGATVTIEAVAATAHGFVAVGIDRPSAATSSAHPVAYTSTDGQRWTAADVPPDPNDGFVSLAAGAQVLYAVSQTPDAVPGISALWSSPDGGEWTRVVAPPLGVIDQGAGVGSLNGSYVGDGTRVLGYVRGQGTMTIWVSVDGSAASMSAVTGDLADRSAALGVDSTPWLLRNGILFATADRTWIATAQP